MEVCINEQKTIDFRTHPLFHGSYIYSICEKLFFVYVAFRIPAYHTIPRDVYVRISMQEMCVRAVPRIYYINIKIANVMVALEQIYCFYQNFSHLIYHTHLHTA